MKGKWIYRAPDAADGSLSGAYDAGGDPVPNDIAEMIVNRYFLKIQGDAHTKLKVVVAVRWSQVYSAAENDSAPAGGRTLMRGHETVEECLKRRNLGLTIVGHSRNGNFLGVGSLWEPVEETAFRWIKTGSPEAQTFDEGV